MKEEARKMLDAVLNGGATFQDFAQANGGVVSGEEVTDYLLSKEVPASDLNKIDIESVMILANILTVAGKNWQVQQSAKATQCYEKEKAYLMAAVERGHPRATLQMATLLSESNPQEALQYLQKAAEAGFAEAQFKFGNHYAQGAAGTFLNKDPKQAFWWWQRAAEAKPPFMPAVYQIAKCYAEGFGVEVNLGLHAENLTQAAETFGPAAYQLAQAYKLGVKKDGYDVFLKDLNQYVNYLKKAADLGHISAAKEFAAGVQDPIEKLRYYQIAAKGGDGEAKANLTHLDPQGISRALLEKVDRLTQRVDTFSEQINLLQKNNNTSPKENKGSGSRHGFYSTPTAKTL